jgi:hypothetical protein
MFDRREGPIRGLLDVLANGMALESAVEDEDDATAAAASLD